MAEIAGAPLCTSSLLSSFKGAQYLFLFSGCHVGSSFVLTFGVFRPVGARDASEFASSALASGLALLTSSLLAIVCDKSRRGFTLKCSIDEGAVGPAVSIDAITVCEGSAIGALAVSFPQVEGAGSAGKAG